MTAARRLVDDLLDIDYYEPTVHPSIDFRRPIRVNLSMSLYQILQVDERSQSISVNVWMVQDWYDQFLDWDPREYEMINKTILPYNEVWVPGNLIRLVPHSIFYRYVFVQFRELGAASNGGSDERDYK
jgi:hypothetical protein